MTDPLMMEIDQELRNQQIKDMWSKYGQWVIGIVLIAIVSTIVGVVWHSVLNSALTKQSGTLLTVLQEEASNPNTAQTLKDLNKDADFPLKAVVGVYRAQKLEQANDLAAAQNVYKDMMDQPRLSAIVRNLSRVHFVRLGIVLKQDPEALIKTLHPITSDDKSSFRPSALELQALLLIQQGKQDEANKLLSQLSSNSDAPANLRTRARSLISYQQKQ